MMRVSFVSSISFLKENEMSLLSTFWSVLRHYNEGSGFFRSKKRRGLLCTALLLSFAMVACSDGTSSAPAGSSNNGSTGSAPQATPPPAALSNLHWCGKPSMVFRDQADANAAKNSPQTKLGPANGTPTAINDWTTVKENLGFTIFLPKTLPGGSCLLNVSSSLRDPIFGSNFTITYVLPDQNSVSFSQAPSRAQNTSFQCNVSDAPADGNGVAKKETPGATPAPTANPVQLCNGVREKTNIVFSARGATPTLEQFFQGLQPDVDWMPAK